MPYGWAKLPAEKINGVLILRKLSFFQESVSGMLSLIDKV